MIEGYYRMHLIYRLLSEDLIDDQPVAPADGNDPAALLAERIAKATQTEAALVERTLRSLIAAGHLGWTDHPQGRKWQWAPNRRQPDNSR
jgi:hypothetical protein